MSLPSTPALSPLRGPWQLPAFFILAASLLAAGGTYLTMKPGPLPPALVRGADGQEFIPPKAEGELPPWGELKRVRMVTEKPGEFIEASLADQEANDWTFAGLDGGGIRQRLHDAGVPPDITDALLTPPFFQQTAAGSVIRPSDEYVLSLSAEHRRRLYKELRRADAGHFQVYPFCFPAGKCADMLHGLVAPETLSLISRLLYRVGKADCFADVGPVFRGIPDANERRRLLKALTRQNTLILKAVIRPDTNVAQMLSYWTTPVRKKDLQPLLESLTRVPGGVLLDSVHLLPAFARQRLYIYPETVTTGQRQYDCHWSSLNFLRHEPDMRFLNSPDVAAALQTEYELVPAATRLGDVILFTTDGANVVHSCVYVADDVVFTKNGANVMQPWLYMTLPEIEIVYPSDEPYKILTYRLKGQ